MDVTTVLQVAGPLLAIGGAWGGAKVALNGTRERVKELRLELAENTKAAHERAHEIKAELAAHTRADDAVQRELIDRSARIETKLDILMEKR